MSWSDRQRVTALAMVALVLAVPLLWQIGDARLATASEHRQAKIAEPVAARQAPADYDGDGFPDASDACPTRPETDNGFQDDDGCPDVAATTGAS
ncbi:MAG: hypothetical protein ABEJ74_03985 [Haloferacaceae archaeon]